MSNIENYVITTKLDARAQLHLMRKLAAALHILDGLAADENKGKDMSFLTVMILAQLNDADSDFVVNRCLSVVSRKQGDTLSKVLSPTGSIMFDDLTVDQMLNLTAKVLESNLGDFLRTALHGLA